MSKLPILHGKQVLCYDIEVFPNYFLMMMYDGEQFVQYSDPVVLQRVMDKYFNRYALAGFNNSSYDDIVLKNIWNGMTKEYDIFMLSEKIINSDRDECFEYAMGQSPWAFSMDVHKMLNKKGGLKAWQCHDHAKNVAECPIPFAEPVAPESIPLVVEYCKNDVLTTHALLVKNWSAVDMRRILTKNERRPRLYTKGDAAVAETLIVDAWFDKCRSINQPTSSDEIKSACEASPHNTAKMFPAKDVLYPVVKFQTPEFQEMFELFKHSEITYTKDIDPDAAWTLYSPRDTWRDVRSKTNPRKVRVPWFDTMPLAGKTLGFKMGGLHSEDEPGIFRSDDEYVILDVDVASYYPSQMIVYELSPHHMPGLLPSLINEWKVSRMRIKNELSALQPDSPEVADMKIRDMGFKTLMNGVSGKLDESRSKIRSVFCAHQIRVNGQLMILMLIERLVAAGAELISTNTDGVTVRAKRSLDLEPALRSWEWDTKMTLDRAIYDLYIRINGNSYIAKTSKGKLKYKGALNDESMNTSGGCVKKAVEEYFLNGVDPKTTIDNCDDVKDFMYYLVSSSAGLLYHNRNLIGKVARWYISLEGLSIERYTAPTAKRPKASWVTIPMASSATMALELPDEIPADLDRKPYIEQAWKLIKSVTPAPKKARRKSKTCPISEPPATEDLLSSSQPASTAEQPTPTTCFDPLSGWQRLWRQRSS